MNSIPCKEYLIGNAKKSNTEKCRQVSKVQLFKTNSGKDTKAQLAELNIKLKETVKLTELWNDFLSSIR